jgi:ubiquinol-cytochrome c reductase cytochrome b subunit
MMDLVHRINGNIRNSARMPQLARVCSVLNIPYIPPVPLTINNAWYSGFFDADGTITAKFESLSPTITIAVSNKLVSDVEVFLTFGGSVFYSKSGYGHYVWSISGESAINNMLEYFKLNPSRSHKAARLTLVKLFYELKAQKAHLQLRNPSAHNDYIALKEKWSRWEE